MEEGFYAVDVNTLAVTTLKARCASADQRRRAHPARQPRQGLLQRAGPDCLCQQRRGQLVRRRRSFGFNNPPACWRRTPALISPTAGPPSSERTSPKSPARAASTATPTRQIPIWALGWDKRSVLLKLLDDGAWRTFRLPKGSYTHDAFHGWYTEWPRIREIVDGKLLMHMHGLFYDFPKTFSAANTAGIQPICTYLKMPVDYCWWNGQIVMGRDDASTTGGNIWAGQSHSAPWFGQLSDLEKWGAPAGFGGPWKDDAVTAGAPSEPFLVAGFTKRVLHLKHTTAAAVNFTLQHDATGTGAWAKLTNVSRARATATPGTCLPPTARHDLGAPGARPERDRRHRVSSTSPIRRSRPRRSCSPALPMRPRRTASATASCARRTATRARCSSPPRRSRPTALRRRATTKSTARCSFAAPPTPAPRTRCAPPTACRTPASPSTPPRSIYTEGTNRFRLPKKLRRPTTRAFASGWPRGVREVVTERSCSTPTARSTNCR